MYMLDPDRGSRRRALVRDKLASAANTIPNAIGVTARDLSNRAEGLASQVTSLFSSKEVPDEVLVQRVRSKMGRVVSHPHAIQVKADHGRVTLSGPILAREVDDLLAIVSLVTSVTDVDNQLEAHEQADNLPSLQGEGTRPGYRFELMQENWSPTARVLAGVAGGALAAYALSRRDAVSLALGAVGVGLLTRGVTNMEMKRLVGVGAGRRAVEIQKNINIAAPLKDVYEFWCNFENFSGFMSNVREVRDSGNGRSHWVVSGPAGVSVEWDAMITKQIPNELLAWKSDKGAAVESSGIIHFAPNEDGTTAVDIKLSYNPPAGAIGHVVAMLFGSDPRREMDEDLMRMKSFIETGVQPHDIAQKQALKTSKATAS
ncbi:MAG TPA: SRPBCC family protein, partial [Pyrinomonadaceae bacterium]|nr:SRPBCC family protein [Pyrinomonadaceae bacterium]